MAIDLTDYITSAKKIIKTWLETYFTGGYDATVQIVRRQLPDKLTKPWIRVLHIPGSETEGVGGGKFIKMVSGNRRIGEWKRLLFAIIISTDKYTGKELTRDKYSAKLEQSVLEFGNLLGADGLRKAMVTPATELETSERYYENYHELSIEILFYVDKV